MRANTVHKRAYNRCLTLLAARSPGPWGASEAELSGVLEVSRTTVRAVLAGLAEAGLVGGVQHVGGELARRRGGAARDEGEDARERERGAHEDGDRDQREDGGSGRDGPACGSRRSCGPGSRRGGRVRGSGRHTAQPTRRGVVRASVKSQTFPIGAAA